MRDPRWHSWRLLPGYWVMPVEQPRTNQSIAGRHRPWPTQAERRYPAYSVYIAMCILSPASDEPSMSGAVVILSL